MPERTTQNAQTLLSPRVPRDTEHERYHPELEEELKACLFCLKRNEMMFDMEVDTDLSSSASTSGRRCCAVTGTYWRAPGSWDCIRCLPATSPWAGERA